MSITIRVPWEDPYDKDFMWNELLAWTVETFGLPGERMRFHPTEELMDFVFDNEQDALVFQLKTNGHRLYDYDHAVEFVGGLINR